MRTTRVMTARIMVAAMMVFVAMIAFACSTKYLEGTKIEDTEETRQVIRVIETYRRAMEARDADMLAALASPNYFEKNGDSQASNNYDYQGLMRFLRSPDFRRITQLRMTIIYKSIVFNKERTVATVRYHYTSEFKIPIPRTTGDADGAVVYDEGEPPLVEDDDPMATPEPVGPADPSQPMTAPGDNYDAETWHSVNDDNEMILELENGRWYILKGM